MRRTEEAAYRVRRQLERLTVELESLGASAAELARAVDEWAETVRETLGNEGTGCET